MIRSVLTIISYALAGLAIVIGTIILVAFGQGYSYSFKAQQFTLNGLLDLSSDPRGASLYINGRSMHRKTPYRTTLTTGKYSLELRKDGYRTWTKQLEILPYQVSSLTSILLLPSTILTQNVTPNQAATSMVASLDRKHVAYITGGSDPSVWVLDPDRKVGTRIYTPQTATADHGAEVVTSLSWSADDSHLLITSQLDATHSYVLVSASGGAPLNLSDLYKMDLTGLRFSSYDWQELYWNSPEGLRKLKLADKTATAVLADKLSAFAFAGDRVIYVQATALGKSIWVMDRNGNNARQLIESLADSESYKLAYVNFRGIDLLAVLPSKSASLTLYANVFSTSPLSKVVTHDVTDMAFSDNGSVLAFSSSTGYGTYDIDRARLLLDARKQTGITCLNWFDGGHLVLCRNQEADLVELDGANLTKVAPIASGGAAVGGADQRRIFTLEALPAGTSGVFSSQIKK